MARTSKTSSLIEFKGTTLPVVSVTLHSLQPGALAGAAMLIRPAAVGLGVVLAVLALVLAWPVSRRARLGLALNLGGLGSTAVAHVLESVE